MEGRRPKEAFGWGPAAPGRLGVGASGGSFAGCAELIPQDRVAPATLAGSRGCDARGDCAPSVTLMELVRDANSPLRLNEGESVLTFLSEWRAGVDIERASEKRKTVPLGSSGLVRATRVQPGVRGSEQSESSSEFAGGAFCLQFVEDAHLRGAERGLPSLLLLSQLPPCVPSTWLALQAASFLSREVPKRVGYHRALRSPAAFRESLRLKHQKA